MSARTVAPTLSLGSKGKETPCPLPPVLEKGDGLVLTPASGVGSKCNP